MWPAKTNRPKSVGGTQARTNGVRRVTSHVTQLPILCRRKLHTPTQSPERLSKRHSTSLCGRGTSQTTYFRECDTNRRKMITCNPLSFSPSFSFCLHCDLRITNKNKNKKGWRKCSILQKRFPRNLIIRRHASTPAFRPPIKTSLHSYASHACALAQGE